MSLVTSSDGIQFNVIDPRPYDVAFAAARTAAQLDKEPMFSRVRSLDDLIAPQEYYFSAPRISGPLERRAAFKVINGGKQS